MARRAPKRERKDTDEIPVVMYCLTCKGETLRVARSAAEVFAWLAHPNRQHWNYAAYSLIDGVRREVARNL